MYCDLKCEKGEIMKFNFTNMKSYCHQCPEHTYSNGGNRIYSRHYQRWDLHFNKEFKSNCYEDNYEILTPGRNCTPFIYNPGFKLIHTGDYHGEDRGYIFDLMHSVDLKHPGKINFTYLKESVHRGYYSDGVLTFYVDDEEVLKNDNFTNNWESFSYDLKAGHHDFLWVYSIYADTKNTERTSSLKLFIKSLEITGVDDAAYKCEACLNSFSPKGSDKCYTCDFNNYLDLATKTCMKCPPRTFAEKNAIGVDECIEKKPCKEEDFEISKERACIDGSRELKYDYLYPIRCLTDDKDSVKMPNTVKEACYQICAEGYDHSSYNETSDKCMKCPLGEISYNRKCKKCPAGQEAIETYTLSRFFEIKNGHEDKALDYSNHCSMLDEVCSFEWQPKRDKIITGRFLPKDRELSLYLSKVINIVEDKEGYVQTIFKVESLQEGETFAFYVGTKLVKKITHLNKNENVISTSLLPGYNYLAWVYTRSKNVTNIENAISIEEITIQGASIGGGVKCSPCPYGYIKKNENDELCEKCPTGTIPNKESKFYNNFKIIRNKLR
jgi:hypothetical protein